MSTSVDVGAPPRRGPAWVVVAVLALVLMLPIGFFYLTSGLVVPGPWLFLLWALYLALVVLAIRLTMRRSWWVAAVPVGAALLWWGYLQRRRGPLRLDGLAAAIELHRAHRHEAGGERGPQAGGVAGGDRRHDDLTLLHRRERSAEQPGAQAGSPLGRIDLEADLGQPAETPAHQHHRTGGRQTEHLDVVADVDRVPRARVVGQVGASHERPGPARPAGHEDGVEAVDPAARPGERGEDARVVRPAEAVWLEPCEQLVTHVVAHREHGVAGDGENGLDADAPGRNPVPPTVGLREPAGRGVPQQHRDGMGGHVRPTTTAAAPRRAIDTVVTAAGPMTTVPDPASTSWAVRL